MLKLVSGVERIAMYLPGFGNRWVHCAVLKQPTDRQKSNIDILGNMI